MKVLILGSGGREHVIAWKVAQSPLLTELFIAPGNGGTEEVATNVSLDITDFGSVGKWVIDHGITMVVVGPENPLVEGIHDYFLGHEQLQGVHVIGPQKAGAMLEGSKEFAKDFMLRHGIPTAKYRSFSKANLEEGEAFLKTMDPPYVLKADGLAAGKGVVILNDLRSATDELHDMIQDSKFDRGVSGRYRVVSIRAFRWQQLHYTSNCERLQEDWRGRYRVKYRWYGSCFPGAICRC